MAATTMTTEAPYHADPYRREIEVWVDGLERHERFGRCLVFSETICHPHGGGQKGDRGRLLLDADTAASLGVGEELAIVDTRPHERGNLHLLQFDLDEELAGESLVGIKPFRLILDWDFRYRQMRLHSAAHLLHCFVEQVLESPVSFPQTSDLQPEFGLNRYETKGLLTEAQAAQITERLNAFIAQGSPISTRADPERDGFRTWHCGDWTIPCGGTHLRDASEIGEVAVVLSLKRGRTSLKFTLAE